MVGEEVMVVMKMEATVMVVMKTEATVMETTVTEVPQAEITTIMVADMVEAVTTLLGMGQVESTTVTREGQTTQLERR